MTLRIGLDFDNTLACYDGVFSKAAKLENLIENSWEGTKAELKARIHSVPNGDFFWQKLQGKVYGKYIKEAVLFPGVSEFLWKSKIRNCFLTIVSHKTEFGHFDEEKIQLREAALGWMDSQSFFDPNLFAIKKENVFFASTREEKIQKIEELNLDYFIDDLEEVLEEKNFSKKTNRILFSRKSIFEKEKPYPVANSWGKISSLVFPDWSEAETLRITQVRWQELKINAIHTIKGSGNSRVYKIENNSTSYLLKLYPDLQIDSRERLKTEFHSCEILSKEGLLVPKPITKDQKLNWAIYEWIEGESIKSPSIQDISKLIDFIKDLLIIQGKEIFLDFPLASEACLSGRELEAQLKRRLELLEAIPNLELNDYLSKEIKPLLNFALTYAKKQDALFNESIPKEDQILSPSDFGFHNSKLSPGDKIYIFDLEYFGWDDPVKLISDFIWHPGMTLGQEAKEYWTKKALELLPNTRKVENRFNIYYPLYGLRWCLILLNEFLKNKVENRFNADPSRISGIQEIQRLQLAKSKNLFYKVQSILEKAK